MPERAAPNPLFYLFSALVTHSPTNHTQTNTHATQGLLDVISSDENAQVKVLRLRIKDDGANMAMGGNILAPMEGDDPSTFKPQVDESSVSCCLECWGMLYMGCTHCVCLFDVCGLRL